MQFFKLDGVSEFAIRVTADKMVLDKMARTKWYGQNGTDKMVAISIDSNSTELNFYSETTSHK